MLLQAFFFIPKAVERDAAALGWHSFREAGTPGFPRLSVRRKGRRSQEKANEIKQEPEKTGGAQVFLKQREAGG